MVAVMAVPDECQPGDVEFALAWQLSEGHLVGQLRARNIGRGACRLSGKPALVPLAVDGTDLGAQTVITLEYIAPGYLVLPPGGTAVAHVGWAGWDGPPASGRVIVRWQAGQQEIRADGPTQPAPPPAGGATNLWTTRFTHDRL
jgi:hypothetical protein